MKKRKGIGFLVFVFLIAWTGPSFAEIYYSIDSEGTAHFTNTPTAPGYWLLQPGVLPRNFRLTARNVDELIRAYAAEHDIDPALVAAVIRTESNFNARAVSRKGAQGLMQLMPTTIWRLSVGDAFDPRENIGAGVRYLRQLLEKFEGDLTLALAAYNAGENAVRRYRGVPPYRETRDYVTKVVSLYQQALRERSASLVTKAGSAPTEEIAAVTQSRPLRGSRDESTLDSSLKPAIYRAEVASGAILYSNIPPIVRSP